MRKKRKEEKVEKLAEETRHVEDSIKTIREKGGRTRKAVTTTADLSVDWS